jgi:hypothetical protein
MRREHVSGLVWYTSRFGGGRLVFKTLPTAMLLTARNA